MDGDDVMIVSYLLTFGGLNSTDGNVATETPWTVLTWAKLGPLIGSGQKITSGKRQSYTKNIDNSASILLSRRWPAGGKTLDSPAVQWFSYTALNGLKLNGWIDE